MKNTVCDVSMYNSLETKTKRDALTERNPCKNEMKKTER